MCVVHNTYSAVENYKMFKFLRKTTEQSSKETEVNSIKKRVNFQTEIVEVVSESHEKPKIRRMSSSVSRTTKTGSRFWFPTKVFAALKLSRKHRNRRGNSVKIKKRKNSKKKKQRSNKSES